MQPTFTTGDLLRLTGVQRSTLQSWLHREYLLIASDQMDGGEGCGNHRRFSLQAVIHFVVGAELVKLGLSPLTSFQAAARFAYFGQAGSVQTFHRPPACPFHHSQGKTLLVIPAGCADRAEVIAIEGESLRASNVPDVDGGSSAFVALDLGKVFNRTLRALGMDPERELRLAYGECV